MASKELFIFKTFYPLELKTESLKVHKSISRIKLSAHTLYLYLIILPAIVFSFP